MPRGGKRSTSFKKGDPRINRTGKNKQPKEIREIKKLTNQELIVTVNKYLYCTVDELKEAFEDKTTPVLDKMVISVMRKGIMQGDERKMEYIIGRLIGKVPDKIKHEGSLVTKTVDLSKIKDKDLIAIAKS